MRYLVSLCLLFLGLVSCDKTPKDNDEAIKKEVISELKKKIIKDIHTEYKEVFSDDKDTYVKVQQIVLKNGDKYIDELELKLTGVITTDFKKEIGKGFYEAELNMVDKNPIDRAKIEEAKFEIHSYEYDISNFTPTIKYTTQISDDKKLYVKILNYEDLEIIKDNIATKILLDVEAELTKGLEYKSKKSSLRDLKRELTEEKEYPVEVVEEYYPSNYYEPDYYIVNASEYNKVYFHNAPDHSTRRNAYFNSREMVFVQNFHNGFGYVEFINDKGQTSKGWIPMYELEEL